MEKPYEIGRIAGLKRQLRRLIVDLHNDKVTGENAADEIIELRDEIERLVGDLNAVEHQ